MTYCGGKPGEPGAFIGGDADIFTARSEAVSHCRGCPDCRPCKRCDGEGAYSELAPCTTGGPDCACNGPSVIVDPCPACHGTGTQPRVAA